MKLYKLTINHVHVPTGAIISSYHSQRTEKSSEYFLDKKNAEARQDEIFTGLQKLVGYVPDIETRIDEIETKD